jgi:cyclopropane-fatty-acyl-phospholipid synthase
MSVLQLGVEAVERGLVPDAMTRVAIRRLCGLRLRDTGQHDAASAQAGFIDSMRHGPVAPVPHLANEQHYELPPEFFGLFLGTRRKYSCCFWDGHTTLDEAEKAALAITCERAGVANGQQILELGCGWGSLSLWMAEQYPASTITAVSNSAPQRNFIEAAAQTRGLTNLRVITADMNEFAPVPAPGSFTEGPRSSRFDRVVSVEMFEHMRNYELLLSRIASWLRPGGKLFVHVFCHRTQIYPFEADGAENWMGRYFFSGGIMPNAGLFRNFNRDLTVTGHWTWNGTHYQRTAEAWLANLDARRNDAFPILRSVYGGREASRWFHRWRMFLMAVAELFGFAKGEEWFVAHSLLEPNR